MAFRHRLDSGLPASASPARNPRHRYLSLPRSSIVATTRLLSGDRRMMAKGTLGCTENWFFHAVRANPDERSFRSCCSEARARGCLLARPRSWSAPLDFMATLGPTTTGLPTGLEPVGNRNRHRAEGYPRRRRPHSRGGFEPVGWAHLDSVDCPRRRSSAACPSLGCARPPAPWIRFS